MVQLRWIWRHIPSSVLLILGGLLIGLLCVEVGLRVLEVFGPEQFYRAGLSQYRIPDQQLGVRLAPYAPGHDASGFRNEVVPGQADIVAIGDSQTWGINVNRSQAWPQTLARLSGHSTYNMALGGYGLVEYLVLTKEALELSPKVIVIGLYLGNDVWGAYNTVYQRDIHSRFRNSEVGADLFNDTIIPQRKALTSEKAEYRTWLQRSIFAKWGLALKEHSATLRLLADSVARLGNTMYHQAEAWAQAHPDKVVVYKDDSIRTVLEPAFRLPGLDMDEPRIIEGLRITKEMLFLIRNETDTVDVRLLILLIPTKETVYADAVRTSHGYLGATYIKLVQMEAQIRNEIVLLCKEQGIEYVDALPTLAGAVQRGEEIYPNFPDAHPIARGYFLIASTVNEALNR